MRIRLALGIVGLMLLSQGCSTDAGGPTTSTVGQEMVDSEPASDAGAQAAATATVQALPTPPRESAVRIGEALFAGESIRCVQSDDETDFSLFRDLNVVILDRERIRSWVIARPEVRPTTPDEQSEDPARYTFLLPSDAIEEVLWSEDADEAVTDVRGWLDLEAGSQLAKLSSTRLLIAVDETGSPVATFFGEPGRWRPKLDCRDRTFEASASELAALLGEEPIPDRLTSLMLAAFGLPTEGVDPADVAALVANAEGSDVEVAAAWDDLEPADRFLADAPPSALAGLRPLSIDVRVPEAWKADEDAAVLCLRVALGWGDCAVLSLELISLTVDVDANNRVSFVLLDRNGDIKGPLREIGTVDVGDRSYIEVMVTSDSDAKSSLDGDGQVSVAMVG